MKRFLPFLLIGFLVCCTSPETPKAPKARATVDFEITQRPFTIYYDYWNDSWYADLTLLFTERAGVGATVTSIEVHWLQNDSSIASTYVAGKWIRAYGSAYVSFRTEFPAKYRPQKMTITAFGHDDNGYSFNKTKSYDINWNSQSAPRLNKK